MQTLGKTEYPALKRLGSQIGHGVAIGVSLVLVYVVQNLEEWGILPFLTERFGEVVPWITFSLLAGIVAYLAYIVFESQAVRWTGEIFTNLISIAVIWKVFTVFPFDFSSYDFPWSLLTRFVLVIAIVGAAIGIVADVVKLVNPRETEEKGVSDAHGI